MKQLDLFAFVVVAICMILLCGSWLYWAEKYDALIVRLEQSLIEIERLRSSVQGLEHQNTTTVDTMPRLKWDPRSALPSS